MQIWPLPSRVFIHREHRMRKQRTFSGTRIFQLPQTKSHLRVAHAVGGNGAAFLPDNYPLGQGAVGQPGKRKSASQRREGMGNKHKQRLLRTACWRNQSKKYAGKGGNRTAHWQWGTHSGGMLRLQLMERMDGVVGGPVCVNGQANDTRRTNQTAWLPGDGDGTLPLMRMGELAAAVGGAGLATKWRWGQENGGNGQQSHRNCVQCVYVCVKGPKKAPKNGCENGGLPAAVAISRCG